MKRKASENNGLVVVVVVMVVLVDWKRVSLVVLLNLDLNLSLRMQGFIGCTNGDSRLGRDRDFTSMLSFKNGSSLIASTSWLLCGEVTILKSLLTLSTIQRLSLQNYHKYNILGEFELQSMLPLLKVMQSVKNSLFLQNPKHLPLSARVILHLPRSGEHE